LLGAKAEKGGNIDRGGIMPTAFVVFTVAMGQNLQPSGLVMDDPGIAPSRDRRL